MDLFYVNFKRLAMLVLLMKINLSWLDKFLTRLHSRLSTQGCCFPSQIPISPFPERKDNNIFWKISLAQYAQKNIKKPTLSFSNRRRSKRFEWPWRWGWLPGVERRRTTFSTYSFWSQVFLKETKNKFIELIRCNGFAKLGCKKVFIWKKVLLLVRKYLITT